MKFVSKLALGAALTLSASLAATAPAAAQRNNEKKAEEPTLKVSDEFRAAAAAAEAPLTAKNVAAATPLVAAAEGLVKNDDEKWFAAWLRLRLEAARGDEAAQIAPLQVLVASPRTAPEQLAVYRRVLPYYQGVALNKQKKPADAIPLLLQARQSGMESGDLAIELANAYAATGKNAEVAAEVDRAIKSNEAAGQKAPDAWYKFAISKVRSTGDRALMASWLTRYIQAYPTVQNWRWSIQVYRQGAPAAGDAKFEQMAMYRLMRATNALADRNDYIQYSFIAQQSGLPWEAVAVVEEGRKSGKLPAGESESQRTLTASQAAVKAEGSLEGLARQATSAANGRSAQQTADAFLASGNYARALELYDLSLQKGSVNADEVNLNRGVALRALGRKEEAKTAFAAVKNPGYANIAMLWQTSIDFPPLTA